MEQRQECCNEAWPCAVNTNSNLLKEHEDQVLHQSTQTLKTVNIKQHQDDDQAIKRVKEIILNNEQILAKDKFKEDPAVQKLLRERKKLKVNSNNILVRSTEEIDQIVTTITEMAHLLRIPQKHCTSWSRKTLPPSKVKSLLAKHGTRYQVFHRQ